MHGVCVTMRGVREGLHVGNQTMGKWGCMGLLAGLR